MEKKLSQNADQMELMRISILLFWSIVFIACEFGEMVTERFEYFNEAIEQCNWYLFSLDVQRVFVIVLSNTQQSIFLKGFGNIALSRDTFKRVLEILLILLDTNLKVNEKKKSLKSLFILILKTIHGSYSYFMVLRQLDV